MSVSLEDLRLRSETHLRRTLNILEKMLNTNDELVRVSTSYFLSGGITGEAFEYIKQLLYVHGNSIEAAVEAQGEVQEDVRSALFDDVVRT